MFGAFNMKRYTYKQVTTNARKPDCLYVFQCLLYNLDFKCKVFCNFYTE